jgi:ribosomal protein S27AE
MDKLCKKCLRRKPMGEFYPHPGMSDGHLNKCKECTKADVRDARAAHPEYYRQYDRMRYDARGKRGTASKEAQRRGSIAWVQRNPEKRKCHIIVGNAIRDGKLLRPKSCSKCGDIGRIDAHHEDYSKPFKIEWLCKRCHSDTWTKPRRAMNPRKRGGYVGSMKPTRAA